ncbi:MAG: transposase [Burkholderiaceae bacterium]
MARMARLCIADQAHLVIQRAFGAETVLADAADNHTYLAHLREAAALARVELHAFALLPTQVRLLVTPRHASALGSMLQAAGRRFVAAYNRRHDRSGRLWDGRFHAAVIDAETHFVECLRFVEAAPVQLGLVQRADEWPWSSAAHHTGLRSIPGLADHPQLWALGNTPFEREAVCERLLRIPLAQARIDALEAAARSGWAAGPPTFADAMARLVKRRVRPGRRGRPAAKRAGHPISSKARSVPK